MDYSRLRLEDLRETGSRVDDDEKGGRTQETSSDEIQNSRDRLSGNSAISSRYSLKRKCREAYGDDFEKKWDCIRSGTAPRE